MRSSVITNEQAQNHFVENYRFKVLGSDKKQNEHHESHTEATQTNSQLLAQNFSQPQVQEAMPVSQDSAANASFVEELLKRVDELSSNIVKLQMQIESKESEFAKRLEAEILRAKDDGLKEGFEAAQAKFNDEIKTLETRYLSSVNKLENEAEKFSKFLTSSEEELSSTAIEVAKEIVKKEISSNSASVAYALSKALIKELEGAKNVQIRVAQRDFEFLKEQFSGDENIQILADDAINTGGVIIMSNVGNIDGTLQARFEKIKKIIGE